MLTADRVCHGFDERLESERFAHHSRSSELGGFAQRLLVAGAHDDRDIRVALVDASQYRARHIGVIGVKADEIGDDQIGSEVWGRTCETLDQNDLVVLIAEHIANELSDGGVVVDDQDLSYA